MKTTESRNPNDHNYVESSDIPTEEDIHDEIITTGGKVILSKSDQVEISLEYQCTETLIEATEDRTELKEGTGRKQSIWLTYFVARYSNERRATRRNIRNCPR